MNMVLTRPGPGCSARPGCDRGSIRHSGVRAQPRLTGHDAPASARRVLRAADHLVGIPLRARLTLAGAAPLPQVVSPARYLPRAAGTLHPSGSAARDQGEPYPDPDGQAMLLQLTAPRLAACAALSGWTPLLVLHAIAAPTTDAAPALLFCLSPFLL